MSANANTIISYATQYFNSLTTNPSSGATTSSLSNTQINTIATYLASSQTVMSTCRTGDWNFYQNSIQLSKDVGFMSQFNNMGGTMSYLVNNVVGTPRLLNNLNNS